jgi:hypothetical protein
LEPGERETIEFKITPDVLSRWIDNKGFITEADNYRIMIGTSSSDNDLVMTNLVVK